MLRAIIFDFNGVITDDETPHFLTFQQALKENGFAITKEEYYGKFLGMDERNCTEILILSAKGAPDSHLLQTILNRKAILFRDYTANHKPQLFPGVEEFVTEAGKRYRLAIASGGRREQIDYALKDTPIEQAFEVIVSAEDISLGKPDPAIYKQTLQRLNDARGQKEALLKSGECLVIEDSKAGIRSALAAGMKVMAVSTTCPPDQLVEADHVLPNLDGIPLDKLEALLSGKT